MQKRYSISANLLRIFHLSNGNTLLLCVCLFLALAAAPLHAKAQAAPAAKKDSTAARRVLSFSELFEEIRACRDTVYTLENAEVVFDERKDSAFTKNYTQTDTVYILPSVVLSNVRMEGSANLKRFVFEREIRFSDIKSNSEHKQGVQLFFTSCVFKSLVHFQSSEFKALSFSGCFFRNAWLEDCTMQTLFIGQCTISPQRTLADFSQSFIMNALKDRAFGMDNLNITKSCSIVNSRFTAQSDFKSLVFTVCTFELFFCYRNTFEMDIVFAGLKVNRRCAIEGCEFLGRVAAPSLMVTHEAAVIDWKQFAGTLTQKLNVDSVIADEHRRDYSFRIYSYMTILRAYSHFINFYKSEGDQESQNAVYVEMKALQTRHAAYLYRTKPSLETWFDWRINQLLEVFSDYGTNAAKGLIYIFYVIIGFAALYFVFPSEADNLSRANSFRMFDVVIGYFSTNARLASINEHKRRRALDDLQNFRTTLEVSRTDVPVFIAWLGRPLYGLNRVYLTASAWLMERFDIVPGRWQELTQGRKFWTSVLIGAYMLGFLVWGVMMRFVNAFALSINAFVTLGYGEIQAQGVARYLAVLEGAVGWFLLSIFSVTLISQLLQ